ncbi:hypothetical protein [Actinokineospora fastidiosa]|nr:hypothetical protein [Actinokineospora fastidiosa]
MDDSRFFVSLGKATPVLAGILAIVVGIPRPPAEPKVNGRMWAAQDDEGHLVVHTNYVFAYAFLPAACRTRGGHRGPPLQ